MLNDTKIKQLKPKEKVYRVADQGGLSLEVRTSGTKQWRFRYRFLGVAKMISLGEYPLVSLAQARQKVLEQKNLLGQNIDPSQDRKNKLAEIKMITAITFKEIALEWYENRKNTRSESYRRSIEKMFQLDLFPCFGEKDIKLIGVADVLAMQDHTLRRIKKQNNYGTGEVTAIRNRQTTGQILDYAVSTLRKENNPISSLKNTIERPPKNGARPMSEYERSIFWKAFE